MPSTASAGSSGVRRARRELGVVAVHRRSPGRAAGTRTRRCGRWTRTSTPRRVGSVGGQGVVQRPGARRGSSLDERRRRSGRRAAARWSACSRLPRSRRSCAPTGRRPRSGGGDRHRPARTRRDRRVGRRPRAAASASALGVLRRAARRYCCVSMPRRTTTQRSVSGSTRWTSSASLLSGVLTRVLTGYTVEPLVGRGAQHRLERRRGHRSAGSSHVSHACSSSTPACA